MSFLAVPSLVQALLQQHEILLITAVGILVNLTRNTVLMGAHYVLAAVLVSGLRLGFWGSRAEFSESVWSRMRASTSEVRGIAGQ